MSPIHNAIEAVGGVANLARMLGVTTQAVCFWRDGKRKLPYQHCAVIEQETGGLVSRRDLCPDDWQKVWPELANQSTEQGA